MHGERQVVDPKASGENWPENPRSLPSKKGCWGPQAGTSHAGACPSIHHSHRDRCTGGQLHVHVCATCEHFTASTRTRCLQLASEAHGGGLRVQPALEVVRTEGAALPTGQRWQKAVGVVALPPSDQVKALH